jgi:hypothetical protein
VQFYVGIHHPPKAAHVPAACISFNVLRGRRSGFPPPANGWILDSGAFTTLNKHGRYPETATRYAIEAARVSQMTPGLRVLVAQDYMCEPFVLAKTGLTVAEHQRLTIERYDELVEVWELFDGRCPVMPVLQGFQPAEYVDHLRQYGDRLTFGMWVGVGSVCKRQGDPAAILAVLRAIKTQRPDLRLHGFGVKLTALRHAEVRSLLHSADSMAWSFAARKQGRDANSADEALAFYQKVAGLAA